MAESWFEEVTRYTRFGPADQEHLLALRRIADGDFQRIAETFYQRILEHPDAAQVFRNDGQIERLKLSLVGWLGRVLGGPWDEAYYEKSAQIGRTHVAVRLPQRYMMTAMNLMRTELATIARGVWKDEPERVIATLQAVDRVLDLELAIMLESYRDDYLAAEKRLDAVYKKTLEERLEHSKARFETLVEGAGVLVVVVDNNDQVVYFNSHAEAVCSRTRAEVLGADFVEALSHPDDKVRLRQALDITFRNHPPQPFVSRVICGNGDTRWVRWHLTHLPGEDGQPRNCAIGIDTTEEHELAARTKRAETLASLGTLAAGLAHEIRNPLNAAQLQLMLVERGVGRQKEANPKVENAAGLVRDELARLSSLVEDFLAYARPRPPKLAAADLAETLHAVASLVGPHATSTGAQLDVEAESMPAVFDEEMIKQVLINLLGNAVDAAGPTGRVRLALERVAERAVVSVYDSGPGIADITHIFEPFVTSKEGGTGLGLSIAHRIVDDHGGTISVERVGNETRFFFDLPLDGIRPSDAVLPRPG